MAARSRVFYRKDFKPEMSKIFMTQDDQVNRTFEPISGSLNPAHLACKDVPAALKEQTAMTEEAFNEKLGTDLSKMHPEVFKKGKLKKAQGEFRKGEF